MKATLTKNPADVPTEAPAQPGPTGLKHKLEEHFYERRQLMLWGAVDDDSAHMLVERMLFLNATDSQAPIQFLLNSPGGSTVAGLAVVDAMSMLRAPIHTLCMGMAASFGAVLLACGTHGQRRAAPHARIMIHQPWISGRIEGRPVEIIRHAREIQNTREMLNRILAERTGQSLEKIERDTDRDYWMSAAEARDYGIIDEIIEPGTELPPFQPA